MGLLLFMLSLLPCFLKIGVTLATFHLEGKVALLRQWLISLHCGLDMALAVIFNSFALIPSSPVALCGGTDRKISTTLFGTMCGIFKAFPL